MRSANADADAKQMIGSEQQLRVGTIASSWSDNFVFRTVTSWRCYLLELLRVEILQVVIFTSSIIVEFEIFLE